MTAVDKAKVTSKGQVTIPKRVRKRLGLEPGDEIEFVQTPDGYRLQKRVEASPFAKYRGLLKGLQGTSTDELIEQMRGR